MKLIYKIGLGFFALSAATGIVNGVLEERQAAEAAKVEQAAKQAEQAKLDAVYNAKTDECRLANGDVILNWSVRYSRSYLPKSAPEYCLEAQNDPKATAAARGKGYPSALVAPGRYDLAIEAEQEKMVVPQRSQAMSDWCARNWKPGLLETFSDAENHWSGCGS